MLAIAINEKGEIDKVKIVQPLDPDLDQAAVDAVKRWRFAPAEKALYARIWRAPRF